MKSLPYLLLLTIISGSLTSTSSAQWMDFTGGPNSATGTWIGSSSLSGTAAVTASNFVNGNSSTSAIGLTPFSLGSLSVDFYGAGLFHNPGNVVPMISTPFNDTGDKYHVKIDFSGTTGNSSNGVLPAGTTVAVIDMDINEQYRNMIATDASSATITNAWLTPVTAYVDATTPLHLGGNVASLQPVVNHAAGVYDMFGNPGNFDAGMMVFQTTQDVRAIEFDMEVGGAQGVAGGGGAGIGFYAPVPEPSSQLLGWMAGFMMLGLRRCRRSNLARTGAATGTDA